MYNYIKWQGVDLGKLEKYFKEESSGMKKKILAAALAGAMMISCATVVSAKENPSGSSSVTETKTKFDDDFDNYSVNWWDQFTKGVKITETPVKLTFKATSADGAEAWWHTANFAIFSNENGDTVEAVGTPGYKGCYVVGRLDNWAFTQSDADWWPDADNTYVRNEDYTYEWDNTSRDYNAEGWLDAYKQGVDGSLYTYKKDGKYYVEFNVNGTIDNLVFTPKELDKDKTFYAALCGDQAKITDIMLVEEDPGKEPGEEVEREYTDAYSIEKEGTYIPFTYSLAEGVEKGTLTKADAPTLYVVSAKDGEEPKDVIEFGGDSVEVDLPADAQKDWEKKWEEWFGVLDYEINNGTVSATQIGTNLVITLEVGGDVDNVDPLQYTLIIPKTNPETTYYVGIGYTEKTSAKIIEDDVDVLGIKSVDDLDCTNWWVAHADGYKLDEEGYAMVFKAETYATADKNYHCPVYVVYTSADGKVDKGNPHAETYKEYIVGRGDLAAWTTNPVYGNTWDTPLPATVKWATDPADATTVDWATWLSGNKEGTTGMLKIYKDKEGVVNADFTVNGISSTAAVPVAGTDPVYVALSGELCKITDILLMSGKADDIFVEAIQWLYENEEKPDDNTPDDPTPSIPPYVPPIVSNPSTGDTSSTDAPSTDAPSADSTTAPSTSAPADVTTDTSVTIESTDKNVTVKGDLPAGAKVEVTAPVVKAGDTRATYQISLVDANGNPIQPKAGEKVTVSIKIPDAFKNAAELFVYYENAAGKIVEDMKAKVVGDSVVFDTTHFSNYVISTTKLNVEAENVGGTNTNTPGKDNPHTGVVLVLIPAVAAAAAVVVSKKRK